MMKVLEYFHVRTCPSRMRQRLRNALEEAAALLRRRQLQWLRTLAFNLASIAYECPTADILKKYMLWRTDFRVARRSLLQ
jgi:hypothetical protein